MTLQLPTIFPTGYAGDATDFLKVKADRSGAVRNSTGLVSIPISTLSGTVVGLMPFEPGYKMNYGSAVYSGALGTSVTGSWGYLYYDTTQANSATSQAAGFVSGSTTPAAGGIITPNASTSINWVAASSGWVTFTIGGATTTTLGNLFWNIDSAYDNSGFQPGVTN